MTGMVKGSPRRRVGWLVPGLVLSLALVGCGDDSDTAQPATTSSAAQVSTSTSAQAKTDVASYCTKILAIETFPEPDIDFESATPEQQAAAGKSFAAKLLPLAEEVQATAPAAVKKDIDVLAGAVRQVSQTGDFEAAFETPEVQGAETRAHAYDLANCNWTKVDVSGADYSFSGVPTKLKAGPTSFEFKNVGKEPHELVLLKVNDGVKETVAQIVALPEEQGKAKVTPVGGTFAVPGKSDFAIADLKPGRYGIACFVPVGASADGPPSGEGGPPHATRGMFAEFEVT